MNLSDFEYDLPDERIAQHPAPDRDAARLLVHDLAADRTRHRRVADLPEYLSAGDLLVVNDTRVLPARLFGARKSGGRVELLLLEPAPPADAARGRGGAVWSALVNPARKLKSGEVIALEGGALSARMLVRHSRTDGTPEKEWIVELFTPDAPDGKGAPFEALLERYGHMPLPPYIRRRAGESEVEAQDRDRYQTVYAEKPGAVAAPTAGLHFTQDLLERIEQAGVRRATVTLHVGHGTFEPIATPDIEHHTMHAERFELSHDVEAAVRETRARGGRVVAVGTTSVRVLEACASGPRGEVRAQRGETRLFLYPGSRFRVVDALFTNFHLPASSLLLLVSAFAGRERILRLYREAIRERYRFFSYGDAMFLTSSSAPARRRA